jgi:hypothetical protein
MNAVSASNITMVMGCRFDDEGARYYPPLYFDEFWLTKKDVLSTNTTNATLPLKITYTPIALMKFQIQLQVCHG